MTICQFLCRFVYKKDYTSPPEQKHEHEMALGPTWIPLVIWIPICIQNFKIRILPIIYYYVPWQKSAFSECSC